MYRLEEFRDGQWKQINLFDLYFEQAQQIIKIARSIFPSHLYRRVYSEQ